MIQIMAEWQIDKQLNWNWQYCHNHYIMQVADHNDDNKMLSYHRETALQGTLVLSESGRLELRDNILLIL